MTGPTRLTLTPQEREAAFRAARAMTLSFERVAETMRKSGIYQAIERMNALVSDPKFQAEMRRRQRAIDRALERSRRADTSRRRRPHGRR